MRVSSPSANIASLLHPTPPQTTPRPMTYHELERGSPMNSNGLSLLPPLIQSSDSMQDQRPELPRPYKCHLCDRAFHRLEHQTRHIRTHTGEKPHACNYAGCTKRFSRPDELTRHSRIHTNPNSRRSNKNQHQAALAAAAQASHNDPSPIGTPKMMPPPSKGISKSAPASHVGSPNVSPPHSYHGMHTPPIPSGLSPFGRATSSPSLMGVGHHHHPIHHQQYSLDMLAQTASQQLDRERYPHSNHYGNPFNSRVVPLALVHGSGQPMSRSRSHEDDDGYSRHRSVKKSRPSSPVSTAPSSPTFSHYDSCSPTPEGTPLATPAHSPRLYPRDDYSMQLPSIRHLSLNRGPLLAPMEVVPHVYPTPSRGFGLNDIMNRPDDSQRKPPTSTRVPVHDLLNDTVSHGYSSASSSTANSIAGNDLADRS